MANKEHGRNQLTAKDINPYQMTNRHPEEQDQEGMQEPLSGSKDVKNRNHSRNNKGEGR